MRSDFTPVFSASRAGQGSFFAFKSRRALLGAGLLALVFGSAFQSLQDSPRAERIDAFMQLCHGYRLFNGVVLVAEADRIIYKKAFGPAHREWEIPHEVDTKFLIGSVSKQFTAMLILQLAEEERLRLDDSVLEYLPDYPRDKGKNITLHHLLCHSSGIPTSDALPNWYSDLWHKEYTTEELPRLFYDLKPRFEPGTRFLYSNPGYHMLAAVIEKVTGQKYERVLQEKILGPLGMADSGYYDYYTILPKMASAYEYWNFRFSRSEYWNPSSTKGAGGIYSTVDDLYKWDRALNSDVLLSETYRALMFTPHIPLRGRDGYGYGWVLGEVDIAGHEDAKRFAMHTGGHPGFNTLLLRLPDTDSFIVLFNNTGYTDLLAIQMGLINILHGRPATLTRPVSLIFAECNDLEELEGAFLEFRKSRARYRIRRDAVNGLGLRCMREDRKDMGLALLEFNAEEFPDTHWVYESLGEAYHMAGNPDLARKNFQKTLELDPENVYARRKLKELKRKPPFSWNENDGHAP